MKAGTTETEYVPTVPEWFHEESVPVRPAVFNKQQAAEYRTYLRVSIWILTAIISLSLAVALAMGGIYGIGRLYARLFPPDPNEVQVIKAPESLAKMIYNEDRQKYGRGIFSSKPMANVGFAR